jgi:hypothetical protein
MNEGSNGGQGVTENVTSDFLAGSLERQLVTGLAVSRQRQDYLNGVGRADGRDLFIIG